MDVYLAIGVPTVLAGAAWIAKPEWRPRLFMRYLVVLTFTLLAVNVAALLPR